MAKVVILGAGLTGLTAAYHLEQQNFFDFIIYEKNDRPGGLLRSCIENGFTFDYTGHLVHISDNYFRAFLDSIASLENFNFIERNAEIYSHNIFTKYPFQMNLYGLPKKVIYECILGFVERNRSIKSPKNFHDWVLKHFGKGIGEHFFFPYNSKILSYDIKKILPTWTGRFVPQTTLEAILEGALEQKIQKAGYNSSFYYPKNGGIEFIIKQLARQIKNPIINNTAAEKIDLVNKIIYFSNGTSTHYSHIISTIPLNKLLKMVINDSRSNFSSQAKKLICNSVLNFNLGFNTPPQSTTHWIYYPEKKYPFYRIGFWHNISPQSVPKNSSAIYGELSYLANKTTKETIKKLETTAIKEAIKILNLDNKTLITKKILTLDHAYVIYDTWRERNLEKLLTLLSEEKNLLSTGRFGGWKYSSMQEAVLDGKEAAEKILNIINTNNYTGAFATKEKNIHSKKHEGKLQIPVTKKENPCTRN